MNKGTILYHTAFQYKDGQIGQKLLIVLNTPQNNDPYLCCKTTSKQKYGLDKEGCHSSKNIYVLNPIANCFPSKTWVQFYDIYEFEGQTFLRDHFNGKLNIKGTLPTYTINAIINCIKKSDDVSKYYLQLLK